MKIAIGADHAGFELKEHVKSLLLASGYEVEDFGTNSTASVDYPDYAMAVAHEVARGNAERGVLVCMTGMGMAMAANKVHGIRAALGTNLEEVGLTRRHNDANILALSARYTPPQEADEMVQIFLNTGFEGGRHQRRVDEMMALEHESDQDSADPAQSK